MALTADQAARLARLSTAYDALISGQAIAAVEYNGERTTYSRADDGAMARLKSEIDSLAALAAPPTPSGRRRGRAIRFRL